MSKILVSWVARTNDPYEWDAKKAAVVLDNAGNKVHGPTLTLLLDPESPHRDINRAYIFYRAETDLKALSGIRNILKEHRLKFKLEALSWPGLDPTDHKALFNYLRPEIKRIRELHPGDELIINISPGTPAMHTVWVLLAETGYINNPLKLVQCHRNNERNGRPPVENVFIGIESYSKLYRDTIDRLNLQVDPGPTWNPLEFCSEKLKSLDCEARRFARLKTPILILGERGTGKSTLATWIRSNSNFVNKEFKDNWSGVACGQFTPEMMRSELFGHKKGAFTGALNDKVGLLKQMDKDTLFLDEIGDIDTDTQRLLIKALEEKRFQPLGSRKIESSDFRLITATNRPLDILRKKLDEDFFDRISPLILTFPPLRDIPEDIPRIWQDVYSRALSLSAVDYKKNVFGKVKHSSMTRFFQTHPLPGNYRDLYRVAYRLIAYLNDPEVCENMEDAMSYALSALKQDEFGLSATQEVSLPIPAVGFSLQAYLSKIRRNLILRALEISVGNQSKAASLLGMAPQAIHKFMKEK